MLLGAKGNISVTANVAPSAMSKVCTTALAGDAAAAKAINAPLEDLHRDLFVESNPIPVKWALHAMGRMEEGTRLPLTVLSVSARPVVEAALRKAGVLS
jgi:4-hydroxy-tetrahydrodipicolinate synthase